jgi:transposase InsO family protein
MITLINLQRETGTDLSLTAMCRVLAVNRADYYRAHRPPRVRDETARRDAVQRIALEMPGYGSRRITAELRRQGRQINRKRVQRLMREDNLLCLRRKKFIRTTDSGHSLAVYPNLVPTLDVSGLNQLWVADITYIRLLREFVYLAVLLDAFSRRVIGWSLGRTLEAQLPLAALRMALETREVGPGLVHHSDRGVQYASGDYTDLLDRHSIEISMSRKANPYDNALAESFMKTLKYEEVYLFEYENFAEARRRIGQFLERVYNEKRLHSALGYLPPVEYEQTVLERASLAGVVG